MAELLILEFCSGGLLKKSYTDIINFVLDLDWPYTCPKEVLPMHCPDSRCRNQRGDAGRPQYQPIRGAFLASQTDHKLEQRPREAEADEAKKLVDGEVEVGDTVPLGSCGAILSYTVPAPLLSFTSPGTSFLAFPSFASLAGHSGSWPLRTWKAPRWLVPRLSALPFIRCDSGLLW